MSQRSSTLILTAELDRISAVLVNKKGQPLASAEESVPCQKLKIGEILADPIAYTYALRSVLAKLVAESDAHTPQCVVLICQPKLTLVCNAGTGEALTPIRQGHPTSFLPLIEKWDKHKLTDQLHQITGHHLNGTSPIASWAQWNNTPNKEWHATALMACTLDTFLLKQLGISWSTSTSMASDTLAFDPHTGQWQRQIMDWIQASNLGLPQVVGTHQEMGVVSGFPPLPDGIPVMAPLSLPQALFSGMGATQFGDAVLNLGTTNTLWIHIGQEQGRYGAPIDTTPFFSSRDPFNCLAIPIPSPYGFDLCTSWLLDSVVSNTVHHGLALGFQTLFDPIPHRLADSLIIKGISSRTSQDQLKEMAQESLAMSVKFRLDQLFQKTGIEPREIRIHCDFPVPPAILQSIADSCQRPILELKHPHPSWIGSHLHFQDTIPNKPAKQLLPHLDPISSHAQFEAWKSLLL